MDIFLMNLKVISQSMHTGQTGRHPGRYDQQAELYDKLHLPAFIRHG
jgi:hypothetical protein